MKNFINNTLGIIVAIVVMVIVFAIGVAVGAIVMNNGGDIFTSLAATIVTPISIMDWLTNI
jgi:Fe2+ transport system protein B